MIVVESMNVHAEKSTTTFGCASCRSGQRGLDRVVLTDAGFADQRNHRHISLGEGFDAAV